MKKNALKLLCTKSISVRYHSRFFGGVGHETTYAAIENHHFFTFTMSSSDLSKLSRTSVKSVHKFYLCTGFTEVLNNFGISDDDMI